MLSRTADNLFWLARYVERAECLARILEVTRLSDVMLNSAFDGIGAKAGDYFAAAISSTMAWAAARGSGLPARATRGPMAGSTAISLLPCVLRRIPFSDATATTCTSSFRFPCTKPRLAPEF